HRSAAVRRLDQRTPGGGAGRRRRGLGAARPARHPLVASRLLPGLGPAPRTAAQPLRRHLRVLPYRPGRRRPASRGLSGAARRRRHGRARDRARDGVLPRARPRLRRRARRRGPVRRRPAALPPHRPLTSRPTSAPSWGFNPLSPLPDPNPLSPCALATTRTERAPGHQWVATAPGQNWVETVPGGRSGLKPVFGRKWVESVGAGVRRRPWVGVDVLTAVPYTSTIGKNASTI